ncbi:MAG: tetratricopeptide repeat protein [Acidobacteriia bacterium]|nr:tetratricopeptide repeat protein [Terriglobia bacterium]
MRWRVRVSILVGSVFILLAVSCGKSPARLVEQGNQAFKAHKLDEASIDFRKAIQKDANFADAYFGLGQVLLQKGNAPQAYAAWSRAVELAPQNLEAKQKLADLALAGYLSDRRHPKNLYDELNKLAAQFLAHDAKSYDGLRLKAYITLNDNQRDAAIGYFRKALQAKPLDTELTLSLAGVLFQDPGSAGEGEKLLLDLIQKRKDAGGAYDFLYRYYTSVKRPVDAENILKSKVDANPKQAIYVLELAQHYRRAGKEPEMKALVASLLDDPKSFPLANLQVGDFYNQAGDREQALKYYQAGAQAATGNEKLVYEKRETGALVALGRSDPAMAQLNQSLQANPKDTELRMARALLLLDQKKADPAVAAFQALEQEQKDNPVVKFHLGRALLLKGQAKEASVKWQEALKLSPSYPEPKIALASYALDLKNYDEAQRLTEQILADAPNNFRAQMLRALALQGLKRMAEAETVLTTLHNRLPGNSEVEVELAFLKLRQNQAAEGEKILRSQYTAGQPNLRPLTGLVDALLMQKRGDEAVRLLGADLAKAPGRTSVQFLLANTYALTGHAESSRTTLEQIVAAHPENVQAQLSLGKLQAAKGDLEPAMASFQKARDLAPQSAQPLLLVAETADRMGRFDVAKQSYLAALKLDAANIEALNNLAYLEADAGTNLDEALRLITEASQKVPQQPNLTDTLGFVYLKQKKYASALQVFGGLAQHYPANPTFRFHHGLALLESGSKDMAMKELKAALAAKPSADLATKIKEALGRLG